MSNAIPGDRGPLENHSSNSYDAYRPSLGSRGNRVKANT